MILPPRYLCCKKEKAEDFQNINVTGFGADYENKNA